MARLTSERIEKYIEAADLELGPECTAEWVEECRQLLRNAYVLRKQNEKLKARIEDLRCSIWMALDEDKETNQGSKNG